MIATADSPNLAILELAVRALGELTDSLVFVGGCATGLLVTRTCRPHAASKHDTSGRANLLLAERRNCARPHTVTTRRSELPQSLDTP